MANAFANLVRRDDDEGMNQTMLHLLIALLVLLAVACAIIAALLFLRKRRLAAQAHGLPVYNDKRSSTSSGSTHHRRVTTRPSQSIHIYHEKQTLDDGRPQTPGSPVPEIRVTFPEEFDDAGKRQSGRVVVVHLGEKGVGLEPVKDDLPPYQQDPNDRYESLDLDRVGGLQEKDFEKEQQPAAWK